jgi:hypothetical protein
LTDLNLEVRLDTAQHAWLRSAAEQERPPVGLADMVRLLIERGRAADDASLAHRQHQLEIYRASGFDEHHPDYPHFAASSRPAEEG